MCVSPWIMRKDLIRWIGRPEWRGATDRRGLTSERHRQASLNAN